MLSLDALKATYYSYNASIVDTSVDDFLRYAMYTEEDYPGPGTEEAGYMGAGFDDLANARGDMEAVVTALVRINDIAASCLMVLTCCATDATAYQSLVPQLPIYIREYCGQRRLF